MQLLAVTDIQKDAFGQIVSDETNTCDRCGRQHARVFEVLDGDEKLWRVGSTCCKRLFGWAPSQPQVIGMAEGQRFARWLMSGVVKLKGTVATPSQVLDNLDRLWRITTFGTSMRLNLSHQALMAAKEAARRTIQAAIEEGTE